MSIPRDPSSPSLYGGIPLPGIHDVKKFKEEKVNKKKRNTDTSSTNTESKVAQGALPRPASDSTHRITKKVTSKLPNETNAITQQVEDNLKIQGKREIDIVPASINAPKSKQKDKTINPIINELKATQEDFISGVQAILKQREEWLKEDPTNPFLKQSVVLLRNVIEQDQKLAQAMESCQQPESQKPLSEQELNQEKDEFVRRLYTSKTFKDLLIKNEANKNKDKPVDKYERLDLEDLQNIYTSDEFQTLLNQEKAERLAEIKHNFPKLLKVFNSQEFKDLITAIIEAGKHELINLNYGISYVVKNEKQEEEVINRTLYGIVPQKTDVRSDKKAISVDPQIFMQRPGRMILLFDAMKKAVENGPAQFKADLSQASDFVDKQAKNLNDYQKNWGELTNFRAHLLAARHVTSTAIPKNQKEFQLNQLKKAEALLAKHIDILKNSKDPNAKKESRLILNQCLKYVYQKPSGVNHLLKNSSNFRKLVEKAQTTIEKAKRITKQNEEEAIYVDLEDLNQ